MSGLAPSSTSPCSRAGSPRSSGAWASAGASTSHSRAFSCPERWRAWSSGTTSTKVPGMGMTCRPLISDNWWFLWDYTWYNFDYKYLGSMVMLYLPAWLGDFEGPMLVNLPAPWSIWLWMGRVKGTGALACHLIYFPRKIWRASWRQKKWETWNDSWFWWLCMLLFFYNIIPSIFLISIYFNY